MHNDLLGIKVLLKAVGAVLFGLNPVVQKKRFELKRGTSIVARVGLGLGIRVR